MGKLKQGREDQVIEYVLAVQKKKRFYVAQHQICKDFEIITNTTNQY